jgi:Zn-dependent protease
MLVLFQIIVLVFAFSVHEAAHAWAAYRLGDPTAYMLGRVTLNPVKHIDPWGSIIMPAIALFSGFPLLGWAKPCPVTIKNFRHVKRDDILTTFAGPASNLLMAVTALILLVVLKHTHGFGAQSVFDAANMTNPVFRSEIDTTHLPTAFPIAILLYYGVLTNVLLFVFNLIPIPPLDGSRIIRYFLPYGVEKAYDMIGNYGIILVFFFAGRFILPIFYTPLLGVFDVVLEKM